MNAFAAAFRNEVDVLQAMSTQQLEKADTRKTNLNVLPPVIRGFCAIHYAALSNAVEAFVFLHAAHSTAVTTEAVVLETDYRLKYVLPAGSTALHVSVLSGARDITLSLGSCVGIVNSYRSPALHFAAALNRIWAVDFLQEELTFRDAYGNSAVGIACLFGRFEFLKELQCACFTDYERTVQFYRLLFTENSQGQTPADLALQRIELQDARSSEQDKNSCYDYVIALQDAAKRAVYYNQIDDYGLSALIEVAAQRRTVSCE